MQDRTQRQAQAKKHIGLMRNVFVSEIEASIAGTRIYEDGDGREIDVREPVCEQTATRVTTDFASKVLYSCTGEAVIIDPAGFTRPGGGYEDGGSGPEATLCADSDLYPILCGLKKSFHDKNRGWESGQLFSDRAAYIPGVAFARGGEVRRADVVAIAAPNRKRALENGRSKELCDQMLGFRIEAMLRVAASGQATTLVCPAFGCGMQGNDAAQVAGLIGAWLDAHPGVFEHVVFSVPRSCEAAFGNVFGVSEQPARTARPARDEAERRTRDDDEDESWRDIELPEGVTLR